MSKSIPVRSDEFFSDVEINFTKNPVTDDVMKTKNINAIKRSIRNIVLTNKGERPINVGFGSSLREFLFMNDSPFMRFILAREIKLTLDYQEPRAKVLDVRVDGRIDANELTVDIDFTPINSTETITISLILERAR